MNVSNSSGLMRIGARDKHHSAPIILPIGSWSWQNDGGRMMGFVGLRRSLVSRWPNYAKHADRSFATQAKTVKRRR